MKTRIIIPARLKSSRFPEKLVQNINGISLIEHIILRAKKLPHYSITVATDDDKIKNLVEKHNINIWYLEDKDYGTPDITGKLIEGNPNIFKCVFFTSITNDRRDNLTNEELQKIIPLS